MQNVRARVWHCCGPVLGYMIPWPRWMDYRVYPVADVEKPTIYMYSDFKQPPGWSKGNQEWLDAHLRRQASGLPTFLDVINIDDYRNGLNVHWPLVLNRIMKAAGIT